MRTPIISLMAIALASVLATAAHAQSGAEEPAPGVGKGMGMHGSMPMGACQAMMDSMRESDDEIGRLVERMKAAEGDEKVDSVAAVVEALVAQRQSMHAHMREMPHMMCGGMPTAQ